MTPSDFITNGVPRNSKKAQQPKNTYSGFRMTVWDACNR